MRDNTTLTPAGAEVYENEIYRLTDEFIESELDGDSEKINSKFPALILFLADRLEKIPNDDIERLDSAFNTYTRLCAKYGRNPTLEMFSMLIKVNPNTLSAWRAGEYRNKSSDKHSLTVQKWFSVCRSFLMDDLNNSNMSSANKIFTAKASYGMTETAPAPPEPPRQRVLTASELPRLADLPREEENEHGRD